MFCSFFFFFKGITGTPAKQPRKSGPKETGRSSHLQIVDLITPEKVLRLQGSDWGRALPACPLFLSFACSPQETGDGIKWVRGAEEQLSKFVPPAEFLSQIPFG